MTDLHKINNNQLQSIKRVLYFFAIILAVYLLKILATLVIPLVLAFFITLLLYPFINRMVKKGIPYAASVFITGSLILSFAYLVIWRISYATTNLTEHKDILIAQTKTRIEPLVKWIGTVLELDLDNIYKPLTTLAIEYLPTNFMVELTGNTIITILYLFFFLSGNILKTEQVIKKIVPDSMNNHIWVHAFSEIRHSITKYMTVKAGISFLTGLGYTLVCWGFDVSFAIFWGFIAFMLNFIPNVGSLIATLPVILLAWIEIESTTTLMVFTALLIGIQQLAGNIIEPYWMGKSFSLNTIAVLFGLVLCTYIWGIVGAILAVPILVFIKIVLKHIPNADFFVRLMEKHSID